jgi:hypothetical protein
MPFLLCEAGGYSQASWLVGVKEGAGWRGKEGAR